MRKLISSFIARLPERQRARLARWRRPKGAYFLRGSLRPISRCYGMDRGTPVDRYFIEAFLEDKRSLVRGDCLEVRDADYVRRFGPGVTKTDVLDIDPANPHATIVGDLRRLDAIADDAYDCVILTQVLLYIDDVERAVREAARIVKPGGALLVTLPCLHRMERCPHYWKFTTFSARYLFEKCFPGDAVEVKSWGNVLTGTAMWVGLAQEDLKRSSLDRHDPDFPCVISVCAIKPLS